MHKFHHVIKSKTDDEYLGNVTMILDESKRSNLDNASIIADDLGSLTQTDERPDKFLFGEEGSEETSDKHYIIPTSEDEESIMIRRDGLGRPLKDKNGNHIINNAQLEASDFEDMPAQGVWCEQAVIYKYDNKLWGCIQGHNRTNHHPSNIPALFNEIPNDYSEGYPEWKQPAGAHDAYNEGDIVSLNDVNYKSRINANTTNPKQYNDTDSPWNYWDKEPFDS
jgi:hypothetical protein